LELQVYFLDHFRFGSHFSSHFNNHLLEGLQEIICSRRENQVNSRVRQVRMVFQKPEVLTFDHYSAMLAYLILKRTT
jgi:hypothetical protein